MKRLTVNQIEKFIQTLKSVEKIDGDSEEQKQVAISYLTNYRVRLEERGKRSVKIREDKHGNKRNLPLPDYPPPQHIK